MTTGAPNIAVTVPMASSVGAKIVRAMRSHTRQNTAPSRNVPGKTTAGFEELKSSFVRCGTAMPTNETGPANATTHADNRLEDQLLKVKRKMVGR